MAYRNRQTLKQTNRQTDKRVVREGDKKENDVHTQDKGNVSEEHLAHQAKSHKVTQNDIQNDTHVTYKLSLAVFDAPMCSIRSQSARHSIISVRFRVSDSSPFQVNIRLMVHLCR